MQCRADRSVAGGPTAISAIFQTQGLGATKRPRFDRNPPLCDHSPPRKGQGLRGSHYASLKPLYLNGSSRMLVTILPAFTDNYIFALNLCNGVAVVDPGDASVVARHLQEVGGQLRAILITHHHPDHIGGMARLSTQWPAARRIGPIDSRITGLTEWVHDGEEVVLDDDCVLRVMATPGHTRSHIVYLGKDQVFCGDVLFSLGCGRNFEGDAAQMLSSLEKLAALPDSTRVYCAHEYTLANARFASKLDPNNADLRQRVADIHDLRQRGLPSIPTNIGSERRCNPFLRCDDPSIWAAANRYAEEILPNRTAVFATLRAWKSAL